VRLSRHLTAAGPKGKDATREMLTEAFRSRIPVQGRVTASIKGGYEVQVAGVRGFCPFSQIDVRRQEDPTLYFNKTFDFLIKEYEPRKRNLILSRRALIEAETRKNEREFREGLAEGAVIKGTVASLQDFGAFVDLGSGVQGLLHVSEISHARVENPADVLSLGQEMDVQILRIDKKKGKISLTRKPLEQDPWTDVESKLASGQILTAKVVRVAEFGAFVELVPGVDGLLHVSELASLRRHRRSPRRATSSRCRS
jgi:small subunit ribosomal protein S1